MHFAKKIMKQLNKMSLNQKREEVQIRDTLNLMVKGLEPELRKEFRFLGTDYKTCFKKRQHNFPKIRERRITN